MARKSGVWWWEARKGWYTIHAGKTHKLGPDKREAELKWAKLVGAEKARGDDMLVKDVLDLYLDWSEANHKDNTHSRIRASILRFSKSLPPALVVRDLTTRHLSDWIDTNWPKRPADGKKPASSTTRHNYEADVLAAFNWAASANQRILRSSPLHGYTKSPKVPRVLYLAPEQMKDLLSRIPDREFRDLLVLMLNTGCRPMELRVLEARHVLLKEKEARIPKELAKGEREERRVPLNATAICILTPLVEKYPEGPVLRNTRGMPWKKDAINSRFQRLKDDLPYHATAYAMRHTFINEALKNGASEVAIAEVVGHKDKTMIQKVYGHPSLHKDLMEGVVEKATRRAAKS